MAAHPVVAVYKESLVHELIWGALIGCEKDRIATLSAEAVVVWIVD